MLHSFFSNRVVALYNYWSVITATEIPTQVQSKYKSGSHKDEGAHGLKKRIERMANRLFSWYKHRGLQYINSVKNKPKKLYLFVSILHNFSPYKK